MVHITNEAERSLTSRRLAVGQPRTRVEALVWLRCQLVREERIEVDGIPARLYDPGGAEGLLLLGHGGAHGKDSERFVGLCRRYAAETGLSVVCIDAVDHGERRPSGPLEPGPPARWHSSVASQMVTDWQKTSDALAAVGPALAYVGFSMGSIFGVPTVAAMPSIRAAVFVVGGVPGGDWVDDPPLEGLLLHAASKLSGPEVLMVNMSRDEIMPAHSSLALFNAIPGPRKRLVFRDGCHDDWTVEVIGDTISFINTTRMATAPFEDRGRKPQDESR